MEGLTADGELRDVGQPKHVDRQRCQVGSAITEVAEEVASPTTNGARTHPSASELVPGADFGSTIDRRHRSGSSASGNAKLVVRVASPTPRLTVGQHRTRVIESNRHLIRHSSD
jgi:hypothetical protein